MEKELKIGFIGQGFIGKNYADDIEERGYNIVRYDIEKYKDNKEKIKTCDIVFIAVPTPTTPKGFNYNIVKDVLSLIGENKIAVIKSTIKIGTTKKLQKQYPNIFVMHSPEFLTEKTAAHDARNPQRNIIGILDLKNKKLYKKGELILSILPKSPYSKIIPAEEAELIKYGNNSFLYFKLIFFNIIYDLSKKHNLNYKNIRDAIIADPRIGKSHTGIEDSGGRGAGGNCFIKDFETFIEMLRDSNLEEQDKLCQKVRNFNLKLLKGSGKNQDIINSVYNQ